MEGHFTYDAQEMDLSARFVCIVSHIVQRTADVVRTSRVIMLTNDAHA